MPPETTPGTPPDTRSGTGSGTVHRTRGLRALPRLAAYPLAALPVGLVALGLALAGRREAAAALRDRPARGLLRLDTGGPVPPWTVGRALVALPADALGFAVALYAWLLLVANLAYPLRPDTTAETMEHSWGGPSLAGAWAVHAVGGALMFALVGLPLAAGVGLLQGRLLRRLRGRRRAGGRA